MVNVFRLRQGVAVPLNASTLQLHCDAVDVPSYDRSALTPAIVHIGVGNFHRAHQAVYFDDLARLGISSQWGITGVNLRSRRTSDLLSDQDGLYTVVQRDGDRDTARIVGSIRHCHYAAEERETVLAALTDERTAIVSMTITANGYHTDDDLGAAGSHGSAWAYLTEALKRRRRNGSAPFTVLSCDNIPDNGGATRTALVSFAARRDESLAQWIDRNVQFPSGMVDRITPKTGDEERKMVLDRYGIADQAPVMTEQFSQWILEDAFGNGRPPLEEVGVEFVTDVAGHKLVKARLLNGTHCALGYLGTLAGYRRADEAMGDPVIYGYVEQLMREEIAPLLPAVPGLDIDDYCTTVLERLTNPRISDQLSRLAARGSVKMPTYFLPSLAEAVRSGRPHTLLMTGLAAWIRYLRGYDLGGSPLHIEDPQAELLTALATMSRRNPGPLLQHELFGDLRLMPDVANGLSTLIRSIETRGVATTLRRHLRGDYRELVQR